MVRTKTVTVNFRGGVVSPGYLLSLLEAADGAGVKDVRFGLRQQLTMKVDSGRLPAFSQDCRRRGIHIQAGKNTLPNIVSSYPAAGIFSTESWLREGIYKDVFDLFRYEPLLEINLCDGQQQLVPLFTGHLNWVASAAPHFWHLYVRVPGAQTAFAWKDPVYTNDIAALSRQLEQLITKDVTGEVELYRQTTGTIRSGASAPAPQLPATGFSLPYYEGFNRQGNSWWLGLYRREELFSVSFLADVCRVCLQTSIGQLYTTPWKSLIIKDIEKGHRPLWDKVLGKHRINVRHAANELNWQVEDEDGVQLKRLVIRLFDKEDVRTYGLCFAVQSRQRSALFGSVIIRKETAAPSHRLKSQERYAILYRKDFDPNAGELIPFRKNVRKEHVATYLVSLCRAFYEQESAAETATAVPAMLPSGPPVPVLTHHCRHCLTEYDEAWGDAEQHVDAGTPFHLLPASYRCAVCEAGKEAFVPDDKTSMDQSREAAFRQERLAGSIT